VQAFHRCTRIAETTRRLAYRRMNRECPKGRGGLS
jgi:hypothetical protein